MATALHEAAALFRIVELTCLTSLRATATCHLLSLYILSLTEN